MNLGHVIYSPVHFAVTEKVQTMFPRSYFYLGHEKEGSVRIAPHPPIILSYLQFLYGSSNHYYFPNISKITMWLPALIWLWRGKTSRCTFCIFQWCWKQTIQFCLFCWGQVNLHVLSQTGTIAVFLHFVLWCCESDLDQKEMWSSVKEKGLLRFPHSSFKENWGKIPFSKHMDVTHVSH